MKNQLLLKYQEYLDLNYKKIDFENLLVGKKLVKILKLKSKELILKN